jgi:hypothetical protein
MRTPSFDVRSQIPASTPVYHARALEWEVLPLGGKTVAARSTRVRFGQALPISAGELELKRQRGAEWLLGEPNDRDSYLDARPAVSLTGTLVVVGVDHQASSSTVITSARPSSRSTTPRAMACHQRPPVHDEEISAHRIGVKHRSDTTPAAATARAAAESLRRGTAASSAPAGRLRKATRLAPRWMVPLL